MSEPGRFIVIEGLDGAGTTTQTHRLHSYCTHARIESFPTFEPSDGAAGRMIRRILARDIREPGGGAYTPDEHQMALLFAIDRLDHSATIARKRADGCTVVCDRYVLSSMAYQSRDASVPAEWIVALNDGCAVPDVTILIDVPVKECLRRLAGRSDERTIYEKEDLLAAIDANFKKLKPLYESHYGPLVTVDGTRSEDDVHAAVVAAVSSSLGW